MRIKDRIAKLKDKLSKYEWDGNVNLSSNEKRHVTKLRNKIAKLEKRLDRHRAVAMANRKVGARFEFKLLKKAKRNSLIAVRSAGSHSLIDLFIIKNKGEIHLINAKSHGYHDPGELKKLRELKEILDGKKFKVIIKLACYKNKKHYTCKSLK